MVAARKIVVSVEDVLQADGQAVDPPTRKVTVAAVIDNPLAGRPGADLEVLVDLGAEISGLLVQKGLAALGPGAAVSAYGKGAIIGLDGELEHAAALLHPRFGAPVREALGGGPSIIPSTKKVAAAGAALTMPLLNLEDLWSFDEMDAAELAIADAPKPHEIVVALVLGVGGRPNARVTKG